MTNYIFYGLVTAVVGFVYNLILYFLGYHGEKLHQATALEWLGTVILIVGLVLSLRESKKDKFEDRLDFTYGSAFKSGMGMVFFYTIAAVGLGLIYTTYINPELLDLRVEQQLEIMIEKGVPEEQLDAVESSMRTMMSPGVSAMLGLIGSLIIGALLSLITAIFMKGKFVSDEPEVGSVD